MNPDLLAAITVSILYGIALYGFLKPDKDEEIF